LGTGPSSPSTACWAGRLRKRASIRGQPPSIPSRLDPPFYSPPSDPTRSSGSRAPSHIIQSAGARRLSGGQRF
jgi:hypothetical protein